MSVVVAVEGKTFLVTWPRCPAPFVQILGFDDDRRDVRREPMPAERAAAIAAARATIGFVSRPHNRRDPRAKLVTPTPTHACGYHDPAVEPALRCPCSEPRSG